MNTLGLVLIALVIIVGVWLMLRQKPQEEPTGDVSSGIPQGKEENFVAGMAPDDAGIPVMYTLTTCRHCVHLKKFLDEHSISHHLVYVDDFEGQARSDMMSVLREHNPRGSFPTLVLPGGKTLVGFRENEVRAAFELPLAD